MRDSVNSPRSGCPVCGHAPLQVVARADSLKCLGCGSDISGE